MSASNPTEAELAAVMVAHLIAAEYDVYQEVELRPGGIRADIVAKRGPELTIIETKTSMSLALIEQAMERRRCAHRIYIAAPTYKARAGVELCRELGIGVFGIHIGTGSSWDLTRIEEQVVSRRWNSRPLKLADRLRPEHKTSALAGSPTGGHWSRWRDTCSQLEQVVRETPGISMKDAVGQVKHHYASKRGAVTTLAGHIRAGRLRVRCEDGKLWPVPDSTGIRVGSGG